MCIYRRYKKISIMKNKRIKMQSLDLYEQCKTKKIHITHYAWHETHANIILFGIRKVCLMLHAHSKYSHHFTITLPSWITNKDCYESVVKLQEWLLFIDNWNAGEDNSQLRLKKNQYEMSMKQNILLTTFKLYVQKRTKCSYEDMALYKLSFILFYS